MLIDVHTRIWESASQLSLATEDAMRCHGPESWQRPDPSPDAHAAAIEPLRFCVVHGLVANSLNANITPQNVAQYIKRDPERIFGSVSIDPMATDAIDQVDNAAEHGMIGITVSPAAQRFHPTHTRAMALYDRVNYHGLVLFVHPASHLAPEAPMQFDKPHHFDEVAADFPDMRIVLGQLGYPWIDPALLMLQKHPNVWADLSHLVLRPWQLYNALVTAHQQDVMPKLLLASGFPACSPQRAVTNIYSINTFTQGTHLPSVPREQLRLIVERNAMKCLKLESRLAEDSHAPGNDTLADLQPTITEQPQNADNSPAPDTNHAGKSTS